MWRVSGFVLSKLDEAARTFGLSRNDALNILVDRADLLGLLLEDELERNRKKRIEAAKQKARLEQQQQFWQNDIAVLDLHRKKKRKNG